MREFENRCRVTGIKDPAFLVGSHIKPWRDSTNEERLDGENGLLLAPHIDFLFDRGWISFCDDGGLLRSPNADAETQRLVRHGNWGHCTSIFLSLNFPVGFKEFDRNILRQEYWGNWPQS